MCNLNYTPTTLGAHHVKFNLGGTQTKKKAEYRLSNMFVSSYQTTWHHTAEDNNCDIQCAENSNSRLGLVSKTNTVTMPTAVRSERVISRNVENYLQKHSDCSNSFPDI
jgi:hypothetical protein